MTNPELPQEERRRLQRELMRARSALRRSAGGDAASRQAARAAVHAAKVALGERGAPWWTDGAPDYNRRMAVNTPYRDWYLREIDARAAAVPEQREAEACSD